MKRIRYRTILCRRKRTKFYNCLVSEEKDQVLCQMKKVKFCNSYVLKEKIRICDSFLLDENGHILYNSWLSKEKGQVVFSVIRKRSSSVIVVPLEKGQVLYNRFCFTEKWPRFLLEKKGYVFCQRKRAIFCNSSVSGFLLFQM